MGSGFSYQGISGQRYDFLLVDTGGAPAGLPWQGGVVIFAYYTPDPIDITHTANIAGLFTNLRETLKADHPGILAYTLVENDAKRREEIAADLLDFYRNLKGLQGR